MSATIYLTDEQRDLKGGDLVRLIEGDMRDRWPNIQKQLLSRAAYYGQMSNSRVLRYDGQSNIELRVVTDKIEASVPKMASAFWNADPHVILQKLGKESDPDITQNNQIFLNHLIDTDIPNFYDISEQWFRNMYLDGVSTVKAWYNYETRKTVLVEAVKSWWSPGDIDLTGQPVPALRIKTPVEILIDQFGGFAQGPVSKGILNIRPVGPEESSPDPAAEVENFDDLAFIVDIIDNRRVYENVLVRFEESDYIDEVNLYIHRSIPIRNNVEVEIVEFEDLIVPYRTSDIQTAERVTHQYWLTLADFEKKVRDEGWEVSDEDMERVRARERRGERQEEHEENDHLKRQKDEVVGETGGWSRSYVEPAPYVDNKILMFEVYVCEDVDDSGERSEVVYHIPLCLEKVVHAEYLEEKFPHGRRPFASLHYLRVSDRWYSLSMAELLAPIHVEVNAIVNIVNEAQELINNPFYFYVPSANTVDPQVLEGIMPGQGIPVADVNGVMFPAFPQQPLANLSAIDSMLLFADRLTTSPQASGSSQVRNNPRTARGQLALLSEGNIKTDMTIKAAQRGGWRELVHQIHALESRFGEEEKWFHVIGEKAPRKITQEQMRGRWGYVFHGNSVNTNREVMRTISQTRFATLSPDPLYMQDLAARQRLIKDFLRHFGEGANIDELTPQIPGQTGNRLPMDPRTALRTILAGMPVNALPSEDHAAYVDFLSKFGQSKEIDMIPEWQAALVANLLNQHQQLLIRQQQAGGVAGAGQANNVPTQLGDLEGGVA